MLSITPRPPFYFSPAIPFCSFCHHHPFVSYRMFIVQCTVLCIICVVLLLSSKYWDCCCCSCCTVVHMAPWNVKCRYWMISMRASKGNRNPTENHMFCVRLIFVCCIFMFFLLFHLTFVYASFRLIITYLFSKYLRKLNKYRCVEAKRKGEQ